LDPRATLLQQNVTVGLLLQYYENLYDFWMNLTRVCTESASEGCK